MLKVDISRQAGKFLQSLPPRQARQVAIKIMQLRENPVPHDSIRMKGMAQGYRRTDIGEYRIVYRFTDEHLKVVVAGKRNDADVYRKLKRLSS